MKFSNSLIASAILLATSTAALAISSTESQININVTQGEYLNISGTVTAADATKNYNTSDMNTPQLIGTLGFDTNVTGMCDVSFTSDNTFALIDPNSSTTLTTYDLSWATEPSIATNNTVVVPCGGTIGGLAPSPLTMLPVAVTGTVAAGVYKDIVRITVASQP